VRKYLEEKANENKISYTGIITGPFLDWGIEHGFILDIKTRKGKIYDGGETVISSATLPTIGKAVVAVLEKADATKNRYVYVKDTDFSQQRLISLVNSFSPGEWQSENVDTVELEKASNEALAKGDVSHGTWYGFLIRGIFAQGFGNKFDHTDNELLGIQELDESGLKALLKSIIESK
jgi:hypothetical protein